MTDAPELSVIIPVYNGAHTLPACLEALLRASGPALEVIVVDDGSEDASAEIAQKFPVQLVKLEQNCGGFTARNEGASLARSQILVFVDADVAIHSDVLERISQFFGASPEYSAIIGSYDAQPAARTIVSQYRNLLHHFVHQCGGSEAETFWTGLGAVRRSVFESVDGFRQGRELLQDVEFGLRLHDAGHQIALDRDLMGTHLKKWTLFNMVRTDIFDRALPWTRIALERGRLTRQLNTSYAQRLSVASACFAILCLAVSLVYPWAIAVTMAFFLLSILVNAPLFQFFMATRGFAFAAAAIPLHVLHQLSAATGFALGSFEALGLVRAPSMKARRQ